MLKAIREKTSAWKRCRRSTQLVVMVLFIALVTDAATIAFLLPVLPRILSDIYCQGATPPTMTSSYHPVNNYAAAKLISNAIKENRQTLDVRSHNKDIGLTIKRSKLVKNCDETTISRHVGYIVGIGPIIEFLLNPLIGYVAVIIGHKFMFNIGAFSGIAGLALLVTVEAEWGLFVGRIFQSVGSTILNIAGFTLLAARIAGTQRIRAFTIAYGGVTVGLLIAYPMGGFLFSKLGRYWPFMFILILSILDLLLRWFVADESDSARKATKKSSKSLLTILRDPYVLIVLALTIINNTVTASVMTILPIHLVERISQEQLGLLFFIATCFEGVAQILASMLVTTHTTRFYTIPLSFLLQSVGVISLIYCENSWLFAVPLSMIRIGESMFAAMITSLIAHISDVRSLDCYDFLFSLYAASYTLGMGVGPILSGCFMPILGFDLICFVIGSITGFATVLILAFENMHVLRS